MYEKMIRCAEHNHCDLVMCDCIKVYSDGRKTIYSHNIRGGLYEEKTIASRILSSFTNYSFDRISCYNFQLCVHGKKYATKNATI